MCVCVCVGGGGSPDVCICTLTNTSHTVRVTVFLNLFCLFITPISGAATGRLQMIYPHFWRMEAITVMIRAVTSLAQCLTDKGEHTALYKINKYVYSYLNLKK